MMERWTVHTSEKDYDVWIGQSASQKWFSFVEKLEKKVTKIMWIVDQSIDDLYESNTLTELNQSIAQTVYRVPAGEKAKSMDVYENCLTHALKEKLDRNSLIVALGGGAIGDLAGFVAATYMRGIRFIQMPTTILAHDSAIGGKVAINHPLGKNMIGQFHQPEAVFFDVNFFLTLPDNEIRSGFAELVKHALLSQPSFITELMKVYHDRISYTDVEFLRFLKKGMIVKSKIVEEDVDEQGKRAFLNFGHTYGHAVEAVLGYGKISHGEAIMYGMLIALRLSDKKIGPQIELKTFMNWIRRLGYSYEILNGIEFQKLYEKIQTDKKSIAGQVRMVLLKQLGDPVLMNISKQELFDAHNYIKALWQGGLGE
jgi:3-dehydroquinate synthase